MELAFNHHLGRNDVHAHFIQYTLEHFFYIQTLSPQSIYKYSSFRQDHRKKAACKQLAFLPINRC